MRVLERNAVMDDIAKRDLPSIFQAMLDAERVEHDSMKQMHLQSVLSGALRQRTPSPEFLQQMRTFILDGSNSSFERQLLLGALRSAATRETLDLMLDIAANSPEPDIRQSAGAIASIAERPGGGEHLAPSLERVWRESNDQNILLDAASAMAKTGTPSCIELLLVAALEKEGRNNRAAAARGALAEVYLPDAVPPLAAHLASQSANTEAAQLIAPILVHIGDASAANVLVNWLRGRDEDATSLIHELVVQRTRTEPMLNSWAAALDPATPFRNEQNREAIRAGLAVYRAGHTSVR